MSHQVRFDIKFSKIVFFFCWFIIVRSASWLLLPKLTVTNSYPAAVFCISLLFSVCYIVIACKILKNNFVYTKYLLIAAVLELALFYFVGIRYIDGLNISLLKNVLYLSFSDLKNGLNIFGLILDSIYFVVLLMNSIYGLIATVVVTGFLLKFKSNIEEKSSISVGREYFESIMIAVLLAVAIRTYAVQAFKIPSGSMEDTLLIGDHLLVSKFIYGLKLPIIEGQHAVIRDPRRGDVIVFEYPEDPSKDFIKRVIGTPGDVVEVKEKTVYVNGKPYENPHEVHKEKDLIPREQNPRDNFGPVKVPENSYFVMGDNRDRSYDSRFWGFVKNTKIKGLAFIKYWSWDSEKFRVRWGNIGRLIN